MLNLSRKALSRIAIVLGIMILIMATFAIVTVFADSGQTAGQTQTASAPLYPPRPSAAVLELPSTAYS